MIAPNRAEVRPRVLAAKGADPLSLKEEIRALAASGARGNVAVLGPAGSGKSTALAHLAAALPEGSGVVLLDEPKPEQLEASPDCLVFTWPHPRACRSRRTWRRTVWRAGRGAISSTTCWRRTGRAVRR